MKITPACQELKMLIDQGVRDLQIRQKKFRIFPKIFLGLDMGDNSNEIWDSE